MFSVVYYDSNHLGLPVSRKASNRHAFHGRIPSWFVSGRMNYMEQYRNSSSILLSIPGYSFNLYSLLCFTVSYFKETISPQAHAPVGIRTLKSLAHLFQYRLRVHLFESRSCLER